MSSEYFVCHFTVTGANPVLLDQLKTVKDCVERIVTTAQFTALGLIEHTFSPQGVSVLALLSESHIAIHTWPEKQSAYLTLATCRRPVDTFVEETKAIITELLESDQIAHTELI